MRKSAESQRLQQAFDMFDTGVSIMRQNLKRRFPAESAAQLEGRLAAWLSERPGAEHGDAEGTPVDTFAWLHRRSWKRSRK
jgi:hypothetical protein